MKKIMTLMLGLSLVLGTCVVTFAAGKTDDTTAAKKKGKKGGKKGDTAKKDKTGN